MALRACGKTLELRGARAARAGLNGSFAVFKKVETDVVGFEDFLQSNKDGSILSCWPRRCAGDGATARLSRCRRTRTALEGGMSPEQLNDFEYTELIKSLLGLCSSLMPGGIELQRQGHQASTARARASRPVIGHVPEDRVARRLRRLLHGRARTSSSTSSAATSSAPAWRSRSTRSSRTPRTGSRSSTSAPIRIERRSASLSGGNQQKVVVAREFSRPLQAARSPRSRPAASTSGSIEFIHKRIVDERDRGTAVLIVSTELDEIFALVRPDRGHVRRPDRRHRHPGHPPATTSA